jgi:predicted RNA-binding Zn-ribbon protein involved in translation (DUF1610 family)
MATEKRLIYLEDAYEAVTDLSGQAETKSAYAAFWKAGKEIQKLPTVDAVEVVHGRCVYVRDEELIDHWECSVCGRYIPWEYHLDWSYCPNCGAKMDL